MRRFFIDSTPNVNGKIDVCGDEARHMLTVLRMKQGDKLILVSGDGSEYDAVISSCGKESVELDVVLHRICSAEPSVNVTLFQCLPKAAKLDTVVQKCVELGVHDIQLVYSARCIVKPENNDNKLTRLNRISQEAAKQSGRGIAPCVKQTINLNECSFSDYDLVIVAYENEQEFTLKQLLRSKLEYCPSNIAVVIGPEGGFERAEVDNILKNQNAFSVTLGRRILRTETAGMALIAMLMYEMEE